MCVSVFVCECVCVAERVIFLRKTQEDCFLPVSWQVIHDYPSIRQVNLICNTTNLAVVAPLGYNCLLILSCTFYAFKVLDKVLVMFCIYNPDAEKDRAENMM